MEPLTLLTKDRKGLNTLYYIINSGILIPSDIAKIVYIADKNHITDYGRSIYGENYRAGNEGPVPILIENILNNNSAFISLTYSPVKVIKGVIDNYFTYLVEMDIFSQSDLLALDSIINLCKEGKLEADLSAWHKTMIGQIISWRDIWILEGVAEEDKEEIYQELEFKHRHST